MMVMAGVVGSRAPGPVVATVAGPEVWKDAEAGLG